MHFSFAALTTKTPVTTAGSGLIKENGKSVGITISNPDNQFVWDAPDVAPLSSSVLQKNDYLGEIYLWELLRFFL